MLVPIPQFTAPSYGDRTNNAIQGCTNLFPEKTVNGWQLISTPGFLLLGTAANNLSCRGSYYSTTGQLFSVHGGVVYEWTAAGIATSRGSVVGTSGRVYFADNGIQLMIVEGVQASAAAGKGYTLAMSAGSVTAIADANYPLSSMVTFQDGYFIVSKIGTGEFYLSALYDGADWTPIAFATAESKGDTLVGVYSNGTSLYLFGKQSVEIWYNTGNASFPFERINGSTAQIGCFSDQTIAHMDGMPYFVSSTTGGKGAVWRFVGTSPEKLSTPYMESLMEASAPTDTAAPSGFCTKIYGHSFYQVSGYGSIYTVDVNEKTWHQKALTGGTYNIVHPVGGFDSGGIASYYAFDGNSGKMFSVGLASAAPINSENGTAITRTRIFGPIESDTKVVFHTQIRFEMDVQFDASGTTSMSAILDWTDDDGRTYVPAAQITMTRTVISSSAGQRVVFVANRLGSSACRYYRLTLTGPAGRIILKKCELDLKEGRF